MTARGRSVGPLLIALLFGALLLPPVLSVLGAGVLDHGLLEWAGRVRTTLLRPSTFRSLRFSAGQAAVSALVSLLLALPGAFFLAKVRFPGKRLVQSLTLLPFVLPSLIVILAVISFYGRSGVLGVLLQRGFGLDLTMVYSPVGIIIAHVMFNISVALRIVSTGMLAIDDRYREVSLSLGESRMARIRYLYLPLLLPSLLAAGTIIFLYCFISFGIVLIFGGVRYATLEVRIYQEMFTHLNLTAAGVLALLQIVVCGTAVYLLQRVSNRRRAVTKAGRRFRAYAWSEVSAALRLTCLLYWLVILLFLFAPLLAIAVRSFRPGGEWSLLSYRALFVGHIGDRNIAEIIRAGFPEVVLTSLQIALVSAALSTAGAYAAARVLRGKQVAYLDTLFTLPLAVSSVTFSLGMRLLWFGTFSPLTLVLLTQSIMSFPLVFRGIRSTMETLPIRYSERAESLGAGLVRRLFTLEIPLLWRGVVNSYIFAFSLSLADFSAVLTIGRGEIVTFPIAMYRLIGFQSFDVALALGVCYILVTLLAFLALDATSYAREGQGL